MHAAFSHPGKNGKASASEDSKLELLGQFIPGLLGSAWVGGSGPPRHHAGLVTDYLYLAGWAFAQALADLHEY